MSVCSSQKSEVFNMTPKKLYAEIKTLAQSRYNYSLLPNKIQQLKVLETPLNKMSLLRDLCTCVGITVNFKSPQNDVQKEFILENDQTNFKMQLSQYILRKRSGKKNKKNQNLMNGGQVLPDEELFLYENLPFQAGDIADFFPILKTLQVQNKDVQNLMQEAKSALNENMLDRAFDFYSQTINVHLQITGPMNQEVAACISKMANIQYKLGDYLQAIELQSKSLIIQEKILGYENSIVAYGYSNLGLYYHSSQFYSKGFEYMLKSLNILKVVCGDNHPDISSIYLNLGLMYQDIENYHAAIDCFMDSLYRNIALYGDSHIQVASCYQAIAHAYHNLADFRMALNYQEKSHVIIKELMPADSQYVKQSEMQLNQFMSYSVQQEKQRLLEKGQGLGKRQIGENKSKMTDDEREEFVRRQRIEKYLKQLRQGGQSDATYAQYARGVFDSGRPGVGKNAGFLELLEQRYRA